MKKKRTVGILVAVILVLGVSWLGLGWYNTSQEKKAEEEEEAAKIYLTQLEDVCALSYSDGTQTFSFTKSEETWTYDEDKEIPMNADSIQMIADSAAKLAAIRELEEPDALADYGLDEPLYTVTVTTEDGTEETIDVGDGTGENYYAMLVGGESVYTISDAFVSGLSFDLASLVENDTVPAISSGNLTKVTVTTNGETTEYTDDDDIGELAGGFGALTLSEPENYHADDAALETYGLDEASATEICATYEDSDSEEEETFTVLVGKITDSGTSDEESGDLTTDTEQQYIMVKGSKLVYQVDSSVVENMMTGSTEDSDETEETEE